MRRWVSCAAALAFWAAVTAAGAAAVAAQVAVTGVVRSADGRPLAQAQVLVLPGGQQATTSSDGTFGVRGLRPGTYTVHASLIGYAPLSREVRVPASGAAEPVELRLAVSPLTLGGIDVTATPTARVLGAVAQSTTQLSGRALERELSGTLAQTLRYQPGIAVRSNGPAAALPVLRGLTGDRVLVLQDGQRTADMAGSADDHGLTVDALTAQRVEVVRGPATLLYGNNALGGVVNVISGDMSGGVPLRPQLAFAAQSESAYPGAALSARALVPLGETWSLTARATGRTAGDMRIAEDPVLGGSLRNTASRSGSGAVTLSRSADTWRASVALRAHAFAYGLPTPPDADAVDLRGDRLEIAAQSELDLPFTPFPSVKLSATAQDYAHDELDSDDVVQQRFALRTENVTVQVRQAALGRLGEGAWGAALLLKQYAATGPAALTPAADSRAVGAFAFQELGLGRAGLQFGARADRYTIESKSSAKFGAGVTRVFDAMSGSIGVNVPVSDVVTVGVTGARSFRAPTVEELFSGAPHAGTGSVEYGDPLLREERGRSAEALLRATGSRVNGQVAVYVNAVTDYIQPVFQRDTVIGGATLPVYRYAQAPVVLRGAEGSLELALRPTLLLALRGDWLHAEEESGMPLSYMPPARWGTALRWDNGRYALGADLHTELAQRRTGRAEESPTDAHSILRLDAAANVRLFGRTHALTLRIDNATNAAHREATSRTRDFAPAAGRNIVVGYRLHL
jgi:iron complex outermembrane recepter protein